MDSNTNSSDNDDDSLISVLSSRTESETGNSNNEKVIKKKSQPRMKPSPLAKSTYARQLLSQKHKASRGKNDGCQKKKAKIDMKAGASRASRASNFDKEEDLCLTKAYVSVSDDSVVGNNQKGPQFWLRVKSNYDTLLEQEQEVPVCRTPEQLHNRFKIIAKSVRLFNPIYKSRLEMKPSGKTENEILEEAAEDYRLLYKKPFLHIHCLKTIWAIASFDPILKKREEREKFLSYHLMRIGLAMTVMVLPQSTK
ncbi:hypothetical protein IV203_018726 [Nitzschia inconspicua]|uniref:Uncharacterized protein n=1 Tax=Nitzschia inconspicua TaxID=303405 RepID=A0A9K3L0S1_9STRA|nr:hypothetical protein IV203_008821 [Nitzschia inconspicua]KAG7372583.1 hypothetical protein IV203_018726 [Nitzschia inconspicua]